jgi:hypothetical protein
LNKLISQTVAKRGYVTNLQKSNIGYVVQTVMRSELATIWYKTNISFGISQAVEKSGEITSLQK